MCFNGGNKLERDCYLRFALLFHLVTHLAGHGPDGSTTGILWPKLVPSTLSRIKRMCEVIVSMLI